MKVYLHYRMLEFIIISSKENEGCNVYFFIETLLGFIDIYLLCVFSGCFFERKDNKKNIILVVLYFVSTFKTSAVFEHACIEAVMIPDNFSPMYVTYYKIQQYLSLQ